MEGVVQDLDDELAREAARLAEQEGIPLTLIQALYQGDVASVVAPAQVVAAIDISRRLNPEALSRWLVALEQEIEPGGWLLKDLFRRHSGLAFWEAIGEDYWTHPDEAFEAMLDVAGFDLAVKLQTLNCVNVVYCARRRSLS